MYNNILKDITEVYNHIEYSVTIENNLNDLNDVNILIIDIENDNPYTHFFDRNIRTNATTISGVISQVRAYLLNLACNNSLSEELRFLCEAMAEALLPKTEYKIIMDKEALRDFLTAIRYYEKGCNQFSNNEYILIEYKNGDSVCLMDQSDFEQNKISYSVDKIAFVEWFTGANDKGEAWQYLYINPTAKRATKEAKIREYKQLDPSLDVPTLAPSKKPIAKRRNASELMYIINCINLSGYNKLLGFDPSQKFAKFNAIESVNDFADFETNNTTELRQVLESVIKIFAVEAIKNDNRKKVSIHNYLVEWLQGPASALKVEFEYCCILGAGRDYFGLDLDNKRKCDNFLSTWFNRCASLVESICYILDINIYSIVKSEI